MTEQNKQPDLAEHLRQFKHNDGSGLVFGYDKDGIDKLFASLNKQPPAEADRAGMFYYDDTDGIWRQVGTEFYSDADVHPLYTSQTAATKAAVAAAMRKCADICMRVASSAGTNPIHCHGEILAAIPAEATAALRELIEEAVSKWFDIGLRYQGCLENNAADADIAIEVDRILAEKGKAV
jgi:hypothetical protein